MEFCLSAKGIKEVLIKLIMSKLEDNHLITEVKAFSATTRTSSYVDT